MPQQIVFPYALGDEVRDVVSGYRGIVIACTQWLNGCQRLTIQPKGLKDGKAQEAQTVDIQQLELVKARAVKLPALPDVNEVPAEPRRRTGGPFPAPERHAAPTR